MLPAIRITMAVALAALSTTAAGAKPRGPAEHAAWFAGIPIEITLGADKGRRAGSPLPAPPRVYVTAPTFADAAFAATTMAVDGKRRVVPTHDVVVDQIISGHAAAPAVTFFVVSGANATADTVRSVPSPADSIPTAPLARAIFVGTDWVRLTSHVIIEYGVAMGWLALEPHPQSSSIATRYLGKPAGFAANVTIEGRP